MKILGKDIDEFINLTIKEIKKIVNGEKVIAAVSGGVDSTVASYLTWLAVGDKMEAVIIDTGFMRENEIEENKVALEEMGIKVNVIDASNEFYDALINKKDAEEKRIIFREKFYEVLHRVVKEFNASYLVQGTIAPDWIETVGKIKTQHNVLVQIGIKPEEKYGFKILEPLANLYKDQVRLIAKHLRISEKIINRQPFPGPGLLVRCVGEFDLEKLNALRSATAQVQNLLDSIKSSQAFLAIFRKPRMATSPSIVEFIREVKSILKIGGRGFKTYEFYEKVTGVKGDSRVYAKMLGIYYKEYEEIIEKKDEIIQQFSKILQDYTRLVVMVSEPRPAGKYAIVIRAVVTKDFMTAKVADVDFEIFKEMSDIILKDKRITQVYYDITPKPPATIEYE
ncbi:MAG: ATP-binding protein [Thermoproteota archaeon]|nr:ATP-binding protein [Thermoproteota archaeon]